MGYLGYLGQFAYSSSFLLSFCRVCLQPLHFTDLSLLGGERKCIGRRTRSFLSYEAKMKVRQIFYKDT